MDEYKNKTTPGVYITEFDAFPPSIVGVATAVPAFIGYTEKADLSGKDVSMQPIQISSLQEYISIYGGEYSSTYDIEETDASASDFTAADSGIEKFYRLVQAGQYNLYRSIELFYANGGANCYIVSVGDYSEPVAADNLIKGLDALKDEKGPTMLVVPEAVLLSTIDDFNKVVLSMLSQCSELEDRFAILDVYNSLSVKDSASLDNVIHAFREGVGTSGLSYAASYFPFLNTAFSSPNDYNYTNLNLHDTLTLETLKAILNSENEFINRSGLQYERLKNVIESISPDNTEQQIVNNHDYLMNLTIYDTIMSAISLKNNLLPPSPAMAGIYTLIDTTRGIWVAPANIAVSSVNSLTYNLTNEEQEDLNVPIDGKAIDAIRHFTGRGNIVWGARTLDGNSNDYRYIQVRRTLIYIEQSIKNSLNQFVFASNESNTWLTVTSMISNFLTGLWSQGGLMGSTAAEAYSVQCGLGSTMTGQDILDGYMIVNVTMQMIRPAEFIELTFKQKMEGIA